MRAPHSNQLFIEVVHKRIFDILKPPGTLQGSISHTHLLKSDSEVALALLRG